EVFTMGDQHKPTDIAKAAIEYANQNGHNVVIIDTAGRLHLDEDMMAELQEIKANIEIHQTLLVVDAMTGQDAVNVAKDFDEKIVVDGVILSKMDGDSRGGAALSVKAVTGKPILYVGMGEKLDQLEQFYPERMASRILGMGDVLSLIEKAQENITIEDGKDKAMMSRMKKGKFDFEDYLESMNQMKKMGGLTSILSMMPGMGAKMGDVEALVDDKKMAQMEAIVLSMTPEERQKPKLLNPSRKHRIAKGCGLDISQINRFIKQFEQSQKMMKQMGSMSKKGRGGFGNLGGLGGNFPF
ncbi:MAG: signal recognition particle protein, partial [Eubacteriales bacterium]